jgi:hypothetical protein
MVQIATTRAQRRDRMTRLNQLQAELDFLERLHALEGKVGAQDETAEPRTDLAIGDSLSNLWDQYNMLSELAPSAVAGDEQTPSQQLSFLRRAFLLYNPHTVVGWILHTLFYTGGILFVWFLFAGFILVTAPGIGMRGLLEAGIFALPLGIALFIIQRRARRNAVRSAAQPEVPNS